MYISPFSRVLSLTFPDGKGIYVLPADNANPQGWGEPRISESGVAIVPGTPGGPLPYNYIDLQGKARNSSAFQRSGNITWIGGWVNEADHSKGSQVLSYAGPRTRYFPESDFVYGSADSHNEVYKDGAILCIAPAAVLGACLRTMPDTHPDTGVVTQVRFVVVACVSARGTTFYKKPYGAVNRSKTLTDEYIYQQKSLYQWPERPLGWVTLGSTTGQIGEYAHESPWFFNESGTEAMCMRRRLVSHNNGVEEVEEEACTRYVATIGVTSVAVVAVPNKPPLVYEEIYDRFQAERVWFDETDSITRTNQDDWLETQFLLNGSQEVMCDYVGDLPVVGVVEYQLRRSLSQYVSLNIGPEAAGPFGPRHYPPQPEDYVPVPRDVYYAIWVGDNASSTLKVTIDGSQTLLLDLYRAESGTSDEYGGGDRKDWNPYLYFIRKSRRQVCGMADMRFNTLYTLIETKEEVLDGNDYHSTATEGRLYTPGRPSGDLTHHHKTSAPGAGYGHGWPSADIRALQPINFSEKVRMYTYDGSWPTGNAYGAIREPGSRSGYQGTSLEPWPSMWESLRGDNIGQILGNGVVNDFGDYALSIEVPDMAKPGNYVLISKTSYGGSLQSIIGHGTRFYPIGTC